MLLSTLYPIFAWSKPPNQKTAYGGGWVLNQGNLPIFAWGHRGSLSPVVLVNGTSHVAGTVNTTFTITSVSQSAAVVGAIATSFYVRGGVTVGGSASCAGAVGALFSVGVTASVAVVGQITAEFYIRAAQQVSCISGLDTPLAGPPNNAVH